MNAYNFRVYYKEKLESIQKHEFQGTLIQTISVSWCRDSLNWFFPSYFRHSYCSITCYHRICFLFVLIIFQQVGIFHIFLTLLFFFMHKLFKFSKILIYMLHSVNFFGDHTNIDVGVGRKLSISIWHETIVIFILKGEREEWNERGDRGRGARKEKKENFYRYFCYIAIKVRKV